MQQPKRRIIFTVALPADDWQVAIQEAAAKQGVSGSEYFRKRMLPAKVRATLTPPRPAHRPRTKKP